MEHATSYRGDADPYTWLYGIFLNLTRKRLTTKRVAQAHQDTLMHTLSEQRLLRNDPAELAEEQETRQALLCAIRCLPSDMQEMLNMRYFEEFSGEEMAAALGISHSRVRSRLSEARTRLRNQLVPGEDT